MGLRDALVPQSGGDNGKKPDTKEMASAFRRSVTTSVPRFSLPDMRTAEIANERQGNGRLGFIIDATGSRSQTWNEAQALQREMFRAVSKHGDLNLKLIHYGGDGLTNHDWSKSAAQVAATMNGVNCVTGNTMIVPALDRMVNDRMLDAIILVGDCFEENEEEAYEYARKLATTGARIFAFHEGDDHKAEKVFRELARITGGAFAKFHKDMPLNELCSSAAVYAVGGEVALMMRAAGGDRAAQFLSRQMLQLTGPA